MTIEELKEMDQKDQWYCDYCLFYDYGYCRVDSPKRFCETEENGLWPGVSGDEKCGKFEYSNKMHPPEINKP